MPDQDFPHVAEVWRESTAVVDGEMVDDGLVKVINALDGLLEPMGAFRQATILGNLAGYRYHWTWGTQALQEGDELRFEAASMAAYPLIYQKRYTLKLDRNDTLRPVGQTGIRAYQVGFLEEVVYPR